MAGCLRRTFVALWQRPVTLPFNCFAGPSHCLPRGSGEAHRINPHQCSQRGGTDQTMSALGQKQTCAMHQPMSALPPIATLIAFFGLSTRSPARPSQETDCTYKPTSPILLRNCKAPRSRCSSTRFCIGCARSQNCRLGGARRGQEFVAGLFPTAKCVSARMLIWSAEG
jgi:hypothetical protein